VGTGEDVRRTGEGRGENFNNQVTETLSRSRKVRTQIPNKTDFVTARDDGQKANSLAGYTYRITSLRSHANLDSTKTCQARAGRN